MRGFSKIILQYSVHRSNKQPPVGDRRLNRPHIAAGNSQASTRLSRLGGTIDCTGFCSARFRNPRIPAGRRPRFESPILHSAGVHHLAPGRKPLQNRGFFMRGQSGLRPRARQNGRLLHRILHRFCKVIFGHLQIVLRSNRLGVSDPIADRLDRELVG